MDVVLMKGYLGEGFGEGNVRDLAGSGGGRIYILMRLGHFFKLVFQTVFWRSLFHIFNDFCVPMGSQIGVF